MKVYCVRVLFENTSEGYYLKSIHSTEEGAKRKAASLKDDYAEVDIEEWDVEEMERL
jgi:hypothetical protein